MDAMVGACVGIVIGALLGLMAGTDMSGPVIPDVCIVTPDGAATCPEGTFVVTLLSGEVIEVEVAGG
jgi:hypothetical protein